MSSMSHISDNEVNEIAKKIVKAGEASYPPGAFEKAFGSTALQLAGEGYQMRLAPAVQALGFEIALKPFPSGEGCRVQKTKSK
ncbi:hypothetical protein JK205_13780 [Gluconobacter cerinus]|nr:hypothetical protein [Gluconobacter thailandicus]MBS1019988.1 hypothetical protein [Gluconobacter cerinus]